MKSSSVIMWSSVGQSQLLSYMLSYSVNCDFIFFNMCSLHFSILCELWSVGICEQQQLLKIQTLWLISGASFTLFTLTVRFWHSQFSVWIVLQWLVAKLRLDVLRDVFSIALGARDTDTRVNSLYRVEQGIPETALSNQLVRLCAKEYLIEIRGFINP